MSQPASSATAGQLHTDWSTRAIVERRERFHVDMLSLRSSYRGATFGAQSITGISAFRHNVPLLGGISLEAAGC